MKQKEWNEWLKDSLDGHASELPAGGWKGLQNSRIKKRKRPVIVFIAAIAASLTSLGVVFYPETTQQNSSMGAFVVEFRKSASPISATAPQQEIQQNTENLLVLPEKLGKSLKGSRLADFPGQEKEEIPAIAGSTGWEKTNSEKTDALAIHSLSIQRINLSLSHPMPKNLDVSRSKRPSPLFYSFYLESRTDFGHLEMKNFSPGNVIAPAGIDNGQYANLFNRSNLRVFSQSFGAGLSLHRNKFSLSFGLGLRYTQFNGYYDYHKLDPSPFVGAGIDTIAKFGQEVKNNNGLIKAEYLGLELLAPIRFEYRFFNRPFTPYVGIGVQLSNNFYSQGRVVNQATLQSDAYGPGYTGLPSLQWSFSLGYRIPLKTKNLNIAYTYSPYTSRWTSAGANLGANTHGIHLSFEMP